MKDRFYKKHFCLIILLTLYTCIAAQPFYGGVIHSCVNPGKALTETIHDLQYHLQRVSHDTIPIDTMDTSRQHGICIVRLDRDAKGVFDPRLDRFGTDMFLLWSDGHSSVQIIAYSDVGLINGIYTYLDLLGFKWFHPGDIWTHIPARSDITMTIDSVFSPDFYVRRFFGTFGTPRNHIVDKAAYVDHQWQLWARRNREESEYILQGHAWNTFLWKNYDSLQRHPEYMALSGGKREPLNSSSKFCLSNKGLRELFVKYQLLLLHKNMSEVKDRSYYFESVEPSDGGGDCECDECRKIGSNSTRVYMLANEVAHAFSEVSPRAGVNIYAYYTHADTPHIALAPNVLVQIIPYRYQTVMPADSLIAAWGAKKDTLYLYDYYATPEWNADMPPKLSRRPTEYMAKIQSWYQRRVRGVTLETSCSIGATGLGLYLYSRVGWQHSSDISQLVDEYYDLNYGKAGDAMRTAQEMLGDTADYSQTLYRAMTVISTQAHVRDLTTEQHARIIAYMSYLHYLKLYYDFKDLDKGLEPATTDTLIRYIHSIYMRMMVGQLGLMDHILTYSTAKAYIQKYWDLKSNDSRYATVVQITDKEIENNFKIDYEQLKHKFLKGKR